MASPKSGDHSANGGPPKRISPDSSERPGVYVQVAGGPRRKKSSSSYKAQESGNHAVEQTRPARSPSTARQTPGPLGMGDKREVRSEPVPPSEPAPRSQSEVREKQPARAEPPVAQGRVKARIVEINESSYEPRAESENTNCRAERAAMVRSTPPGSSSVPASKSLPPSRSVPPGRLSEPSVLDAKPILHSEPAVPARTPWGVIFLAAVMSAIITAAGVVAIQEWMRSQNEGVQAAPVARSAKSKAVARAGTKLPRAAPTDAVVTPAAVDMIVPATPSPAAPAAATPAPAPVTTPQKSVAAASPAAPTRPAAHRPALRGKPHAGVASSARPAAASPKAETDAPIPDNPYESDGPAAP